MIHVRQIKNDLFHFLSSNTMSYDTLIFKKNVNKKIIFFCGLTIDECLFKGKNNKKKFFLFFFYPKCCIYFPTLGISWWKIYKIVEKCLIKITIEMLQLRVQFFLLLVQKPWTILKRDFFFFFFCKNFFFLAFLLSFFDLIFTISNFKGPKKILSNFVHSKNNFFYYLCTS